MAERKLSDLWRAFRGEIGDAPKPHNYWLGVVSILGIILLISQAVPSGVVLQDYGETYTDSEDDTIGVEMRCKTSESWLGSDIECEKEPGYDEEWEMTYPDFKLEISGTSEDNSYINLKLTDMKESSSLTRTELKEGDTASLNNFKLEIKSVSSDAISVRPITYTSPNLVLGAGSVILFILAFLSATFYYIFRAYQKLPEE